MARDGSIFSYSNAFYNGALPVEAPEDKQALLDPARALDIVVETLSLPIGKDGATVVQATEELLTITGTTGAQQDPKVALVYFVKPDGNLALVWSVETQLEDEWLVSYVDAEAAADTAAVLGVIDYISFATYEV